jgi:hypothetical protein
VLRPKSQRRLPRARRLLAPQCATDGNTDLVIRGKPGPVLLRHELVGHPNGELAALAFDELGADAQLVCEKRGRTGRARLVVSDLAVADTNACHVSPSAPYSPFPPYRARCDVF